MRRALIVVAVLAAFAAANAAAAAGAFHRYTIPGYGTSVSLPTSWKSVDYRQILKTGVLDRLAQDNPELAGSFAAMAQPNSPIKLFAYDPQVANGFATNANVVIVPLGGSLASPSTRGNSWASSGPSAACPSSIGAPYGFPRAGRSV